VFNNIIIVEIVVNIYYTYEPEYDEDWIKYMWHKLVQGSTVASAQISDSNPTPTPTLLGMLPT
jgi:hypothetical protein